jgi:hypothetical protein
MLIGKSVIQIKNREVIVDDGSNKRTYTFDNHLDLINSVTSYFNNDLVQLRMQLLRGSRNGGYSGGMFMYLKYREKIAKKFIDALNKVHNTNKVCRLTIRKEI